MERITINPITRLEGHGKIEVFLDEQGNVSNTYFQVPELRGFERFCEGRPVEEMPRIVPRICGVCPGAHHLASAKATDKVFNADPPSAAKKLRELFYCAHYVHSHIAHFYALAGPDFVVGPDADPAERNILGVVAKVGLELAGEVIKHRAWAQWIQEVIGGKATHPVCALPGGMSRPITKQEQKEIQEKASSMVEFSKVSLKIFDDVVLKNKTYLDLVLGEVYEIRTNYMGLVDKNNKVNFYDGDVRVVNAEGKEIVKFEPEQYLDYIGEHPEEWTYLKFPYLRKMGWQGFKEGSESSIYRVAPLARLNVAEGMATPLAQEAYEKMYETLGGKPVHKTLAFHWARLVELLYASERLLELSQDEEITSDDLRTIPTGTPSEGVGIVEAPRGTLIHHYAANSDGTLKWANIIVATAHNYSAIQMSVAKVAKALIKKKQVSEGILNMVEMAFRCYDPCFACATHYLPGTMPLELILYDSKKNIIFKASR